MLYLPIGPSRASWKFSFGGKEGVKKEMKMQIQMQMQKQLATDNGRRYIGNSLMTHEQGRLDFHNTTATAQSNPSWEESRLIRQFNIFRTPRPP